MKAKPKADQLRMNVHLGPELFAYAETKARTGGYRSIAEVVREALRDMRARDERVRAVARGFYVDRPAALAARKEGRLN